MTARRSNDGNDTHPPWPTCGCGRSPIDDCVFWHELTQEEYEAKINSGDIKLLAEVVRDLFRSDSQPEQSYSERQLYEASRERLAREVAVIEKTDEKKLD